MTTTKTGFPSLLRDRKFYFALCGIVFGAIIPFVVTNEFAIGQVFTLILIFAIYASSWNLLASSGQGSLGHSAFLGIGGFASALVAIKLGLPPITGILVGSLLSGLIGFFIGLTCVRLKAWFLAMVTFGFSIIAVTIISQFDSITGGITGFATPLVVPQGLPFYYMTLGFTIVSILSIYWIMKSKAGLAFRAIRENEQEAKMTGINTAKYRLFAFVLSTFFAGLAGALYAESIVYIQVSIFDPYYSFLPLMITVIGGLSTIEGPIIGSVIIVMINSYLPKIDPALNSLMGPLFPAVSNVGPPLRLIGLGLFLIIMVIFAPKGLSSLIHRTIDYFNRFRAGKNKNERQR
jgi:branched-chain amino acid transport system permease protein